MNKMFNFNGMPYKRSGRAGGESVSWIGMLVLLLVASLILLPSCTGDDTETTVVQCQDGTTAASEDECPDPTQPEPVVQCQDGTTAASEDECPDPTPMYQNVYAGSCEEDNERYPGSGDSDHIKGTDDSDCIDGGRNDDSIKGMGGDDDITGGGGDDTLYGGDGDDTLYGGDGDDILMGEAGDDELTGGPGDNRLDGGDGTDIAIFMGAMQVDVDLVEGNAIVQHSSPTGGHGLRDSGDSGRGKDTLISIENVKGTHGNDIINGDDNDNLLKGLDGADMIDGKGGDDTIIPNRPANADGTPNVADSTATPPEVDGIDVVNGGGGDDTISYEGESAAVTVNLGSVIPEIEDNAETPADESRIPHVAAQVGSQTPGDDTTPGDTDRITVVNMGTEDDPEWVSTIENVTGGSGADVLTGDDRDNTLKGGPGDDATLVGGGGDDMIMGGAGTDTLTGGAGNDILDGGADTDTFAGNDGDDTYMGIIQAESGNVSESEGEGMDTLYYAPAADDESTATVDESEAGIGADSVITTPSHVETVFGTQNADTLIAAAGATILGLGGDDTLTAAADGNTLVGCAGENTLTGAAGNDVFGVYNDGANADTIGNFTTGADDATTDEIHLKGFAAGASVAFAAVVVSDGARAAVQVDGVTVAIVNVDASDSNFTPIVADPDADPPVAAESRVERIIKALGKDNAAGMPIVRIVDFTPDKCM